MCLPILEINNPNVKLNFIKELKEIPIQQPFEVTYTDFFNNFLVTNTPCIIKNITKNWPSAKNWVQNGTINYEYFRTKYGDEKVPVADCGTKYFNSHEKKDMSCSEYMDYLENTLDRPESRLLYLKDWHCRQQNPGDKFYEVPVFFAQDWLNEYALETNSDDFMFVYIGAANTWTPLHADVYNSYSWSVNIVGRKKWRFYLPSMEQYLKDECGNLPFDCAIVAHPTECKYFDIIQEPGDAIFVPSGWYHQVRNLENTISINHNWINGCNIQVLWKSLQEELLKVENEISDCKEMEDWNNQCQIILRASFGMNYYDFYNLLMVIAKRRILRIQGHDIKLFGYKLGKNYAIFDLKNIIAILEEFLNNDIILTVVKDAYRLKLIELLKEIEQVIHD